jgi:hypothetical protein
MAKELEELQIQLDLQYAQFKKGMNDVNRQFDKLDKNVKQTNGAMAGFNKSLATIKSQLGGLAGLFAATFGVSAIKGVIETNSELAKLARTVGLTAEQFQEYTFAASQAGINTALFTSSMTAFVKRVGEASANMGPLVSGLKNLNPALLEAVQNAKSQDEAFRLIADAIANAASSTEAAAIANAAFSRSGVRMVEVLRQGTAGLDEQAQKARELGLVIENDLLAKAELYDDKLDQINRKIKATFGVAVLTAISTTVDNAALLLGAFVAQIEKFAIQLKGFFKGIGNDIELFFDLIVESVLVDVRSILEALSNLGVDWAADLATKLPQLGQAQENFLARQKEIDAEVEAGVEAVDAWAVAFFKAGLEAQKAEAEVAKLANAVNDAFIGGDNKGVDEILKPIEVKVKKVSVDPEAGKDVISLLEELQTEAGRWSDRFADTLVSGLADGKLAFKDFANYVLEQLARIAISKALEPLFQGFGNFIGGLGGASAPVAAGLIATPVNDLPLSREASSAQQMIVGVPRMSTPSVSSSPVTVNVMNYGSDDVEVNERRTSRGIEVDVLIKNAVKSGIAAGEFDKVMATSFGARRLAY